MVTKEERAEAAAARATRVKAEKENANWRICPGCQLERRWNGALLDDHNRYDQGTRSMVPCEGSGQAPVEDAPTAVFTNEDQEP